MAGKDACTGNVSGRFTRDKRARETEEGTEEALGCTVAPAGTYSPISRVETSNDAGGKHGEWRKVLPQEELYIGRLLTTVRQKMLADHGIKGVLALMKELDGDSRAVACNGVEVLSVPLVLDSEGSAELLRYASAFLSEIFDAFGEHLVTMQSLPSILGSRGCVWSSSDLFLPS